MSTSIHVDPDHLYQTTRTFWQNHLDMADQLYALRTAQYRLEMAWQGGEVSEEYFCEFRLLLQRLNQMAEELLSLGLTLSRQAEAWDESDQRWTSTFRGT